MRETSSGSAPTGGDHRGYRGEIATVQPARVAQCSGQDVLRQQAGAATAPGGTTQARHGFVGGRWMGAQGPLDERGRPGTAARSSGASSTTTAARIPVELGEFGVVEDRDGDGAIPGTSTEPSTASNAAATASRRDSTRRAISSSASTASARTDSAVTATVPAPQQAGGAPIPVAEVGLSSRR